jgi:hypothetical protein
VPQKTGHKRRNQKCTIQFRSSATWGGTRSSASRANGTPFTVLSVATRRAWKNAQGEWQLKTDWHRVVCFNRMNDAVPPLALAIECLFGLASEQPLQAGNRQKQEIHEHQTHVVADPSEHNSQAESYCEGAASSHFRLRERVERHTILGPRFVLGRGAAGAFFLSSLAAVNVANSPQDRCDPRFGLAIVSRHGNKRRWFRLAVWYDAGRGKHWTRGKRVYRAWKFLVRSKRMKSNSNAFEKIFSPAAVHGSHRFGSLPSR